MSYKMIISIVPKDAGNEIVKTARDAGSQGGTVFSGQGTAPNAFLQILGLGDTSKEMVIFLADQTVSQNIRQHIIDSTSQKKAPFGILLSIDVETFYRAGNFFDQETKMENNSTHQLINIIVNRGFAQDAMSAARKAGATGGTILKAHGTAKEGDATFFGAEIVPEKDMLLIVAPNEKATAILEAVQNLDCLKKPGSGIAFSTPAKDFTILGKK